MTKFTDPKALQILREEQAANNAFFAEMDAKIEAGKERPTPAPWTASPLQIHAGKKHIATVHYAGNPIVDVNEAFANARLIAAAPELLAALELGRYLLTIPAVRDIANPAIADFDKASRAAIAKAKGE